MTEKTLDRSSQTTLFRPNLKDIETVRALNRYFLVTAEQVRRLFYGEGSIQWAKGRLKLLTDHEYASALKVTRTDSRGNAAFVYRLGPEGLKLCRSLDEPVPRRLRLYETSDSEYYIPHTLEINNVLISADMLSRTQATVTVIDLIHEKQMMAIKVPIGGGQQEGVITDGILTFGIADGGEEYEQTFFIEVDMGSKAGRWKRKVRKLIAYGSGPYKRHYDTPFFTVAVITPTGEAHMRNLRHWTADVLAEDGLRGTQWEQSFVFTAVPAAPTHPEAFWLSDTWFGPFADAPSWLIEVPGISSGLPAPSGASGP